MAATATAAAEHQMRPKLCGATTRFLMPHAHQKPCWANSWRCYAGSWTPCIVSTGSYSLSTLLPPVATLHAKLRPRNACAHRATYAHIVSMCTVSTKAYEPTLGILKTVQSIVYIMYPAGSMQTHRLFLILWPLEKPLSQNHHNMSQCHDNNTCTPGLQASQTLHQIVTFCAKKQAI
jgi:hypothetical protein